MAKNHKNLYLYLARRDKKGIKILSMFDASKRQVIPATRIIDIKTLNLSSGLEASLSHTIYENRMLWEVWLESANDYEQLKQMLRQRGYTDIPIHSAPLHLAVNSSNKMTALDTKRVTPTKTMLRKKLP